jgi:hypothetical protein
MKKHIVTAVVVAGISAASLAGAAEIVMHGASAQFDYLDANSITFVKKYCSTSFPSTQLDASGNSVAATSGHVIQYKTTDGNTVKNGYVGGTGCSGLPGGATTVDVYYSGVASAEGLYARLPGGQAFDSSLNAGCTGDFKRRAHNFTTATTGANQKTSSTITTGNLGAYQAATVCKTVNIGTSDVAFDQFDQTADGSIIGQTIALMPTFTDPGNSNNTLAVPFAFYVNPGVKAYHCVDSTTFKHTGGYCTPAGLAPITYIDTTALPSTWDTPTGKLHTYAVPANSDQCATGSVCETLNNPSTIDNISRLQANILFAGQVLDWRELGAYFVANPVRLCLRKPGSGTHVGFDKTVMRAAGKSGWGADYNIYANNDPANGFPYTYFNGSSTDEKSCIDNSQVPALAGPATGAIGYMDADTGNTTGYVQVNYNGVKPLRQNIRNGSYEFYTIGQMYTDGSALANTIVTFAQTPANIPSGKAKFWATANELYFVRGTVPAYPAKVNFPVADYQTP